MSDCHPRLRYCLGLLAAALLGCADLSPTDPGDSDQVGSQVIPRPNFSCSGSCPDQELLTHDFTPSSSNDSIGPILTDSLPHRPSSTSS